MRYLMLLGLFLPACTSRYDAQVAQANAQQMQAQAAIVQAQKNAEMYATLAEAAKPNYWPIIALAVLLVGALLLIVRWHMITVAAVAAGQAVQPEQLRVLLPGDVGFNRALKLAALERGARAVKRNGQYYIVDGQTTQEVRRLTVKE